MVANESGLRLVGYSQWPQAEVTHPLPVTSPGISGVVENSSGTLYGAVEIFFDLYDARNQRIHRTQSIVIGLLPGSRCEFHARYPADIHNSVRRIDLVTIKGAPSLSHSGRDMSSTYRRTAA